MDRKSKILKTTAHTCQEYEIKSTSLSNISVNLRQLSPVWYLRGFQANIIVCC